ncbi:aquaporin, partial [Bradyrhizobium lablabi]|uniref:aquaporin n=1 Tax=Bradyrhizobium lablabi TaxID=722472 RepID=UPI001BA8CB93
MADTSTTAQKIAAEVIGTFVLVFFGCGTAIFTGVDYVATALAFGLTVLVGAYAFGRVSGAHFNPAVTLVFTGKRELPVNEAALYVAAQIAGGIAGTMAAHLMFALPVVDFSMKTRTGGAQWFAEFVAAFGLIATILAGIRFQRTA